MTKKSQITTVKLFKQLEALRVLVKVSIDDLAYAIGVTPLAYKNWKNHDAVPDSVREPDLRKQIARLTRKVQRSSDPSKN